MKITVRRTIRWLPWLVLLLVAATAVDGWSQLRLPLRNTSPVTLQVQEGERLPQVLHDLSQRELLASARQGIYLGVYGRLSGLAHRIKAGEFSVPAGETGVGLLQLLVSGKVVMHELQLIEGWRFSQAWQQIRADAYLGHTLPADSTPAAIMKAIGHAGTPAEGSLFPDTYSFPKGETDVEFMRRAYATMQAHLQAAWKNRAGNLPYRKPEDALIMASLIEKETAVPRERPEIAGVFVRRLQIGMRLQTDPSVIYGMGKRFDGDLRVRDLTTDTPYNTYTRPGLPPTPICLPGEASLQAAVHPASGNALYFVAKGDGTHHFSATLAEHDKAVRRYQLHRK